MLLAGTSWNVQLYSGKGSFGFKETGTKINVSASTQKWYNKWSVGYFELKLHRHILGTPENYITYCKKGHNMSPLNKIQHNETERGRWSWYLITETETFIAGWLCESHSITLLWIFHLNVHFKPTQLFEFTMATALMNVLHRIKSLQKKILACHVQVSKALYEGVITCQKRS